MKNELLKAGDVIIVRGLACQIKKVLSQDFYKGAWDIEFVDDNGWYRHWKSDFDGGKVERRGN